MSDPMRVLVKMAQYERDRIAQAMTVLEHRIQTIQDEIQAGQNMLLSELGLMHEINDLGIDFQGFYKRFQIQNDLLHAQLTQLEKDLEYKTQELQEYFSQEKKYEQIEHERKNRARQKQDHIQQQILDEWSQRPSSNRPPMAND